MALTKSQITDKYTKEHMDQCNLRVRAGVRQVVEEYAASLGLSRAEFMEYAMIAMMHNTSAGTKVLNPYVDGKKSKPSLEIYQEAAQAEPAKDTSAEMSEYCETLKAEIARLKETYTNQCTQAEEQYRQIQSREQELLQTASTQMEAVQAERKAKEQLQLQLEKALQGQNEEYQTLLKKYKEAKSERDKYLGKLTENEAVQLRITTEMEELKKNTKMAADISAIERLTKENEALKAGKIDVEKEKEVLKAAKIAVESENEALKNANIMAEKENEALRTANITVVQENEQLLLADAKLKEISQKLMAENKRLKAGGAGDEARMKVTLQKTIIKNKELEEKLADITEKYNRMIAHMQQLLRK